MFHRLWGLVDTRQDAGFELDPQPMGANAKRRRTEAQPRRQRLVDENLFGSPRPVILQGKLAFGGRQRSHAPIEAGELPFVVRTVRIGRRRRRDPVIERLMHALLETFEQHVARDAMTEPGDVVDPFAGPHLPREAVEHDVSLLFGCAPATPFEELHERGAEVLVALCGLSGVR